MKQLLLSIVICLPLVFWLEHVDAQAQERARQLAAAPARRLAVKECVDWAAKYYETRQQLARVEPYVTGCTNARHCGQAMSFYLMAWHSYFELQERRPPCAQ